jgi:4-hydroxy-3-polyprenylbenzoate decarboxylase
VAISGASGCIYGWRLVEVLADQGHSLYLLITDPAKQVMAFEMDWQISGDVAEQQAAITRRLGPGRSQKINYLDYHDLTAVIASGSVKSDGMIVIPCSMATIAGITHGLARNLVERAADVVLKEKRPLVLVPRETPLNQIHLQNLLSLSRMGVTILPAMPAFYTKPRTITELVDFIVGRAMDQLGLEHQLYEAWGDI